MKHTRERVYFIQAAYGGPIKIGTARSRLAVQDRLCSLQTGNHERLVVTHEIQGGRREEAELHRRFASFRLCGEWFAPTKELAELAHGKGPIDGYESLAPLLRREYDRGYEDGTRDGIMEGRWDMAHEATKLAKAELEDCPDLAERECRDSYRPVDATSMSQPPEPRLEPPANRRVA